MEQINYHTIWSELRSRHRAEFSPEVVARHTTESGFTVLGECENCGLQFFAPAVPGGPDFYSGLSNPTLSFAKDRWEFSEARCTISGGDAVVDFGCGDGAFLRSLPGVQGRRVGIDHSAPAVRKLEEDGIEGYPCDFGDFAERERGMFDVACAFHVIEHLPRVRSLVEAAITCLRPGGTLLISVPNRERIVTGGFPVLDCPPHHISRWHSEQFLELANRFELRQLATRFERRSIPPLRLIVTRGAPLALRVVSQIGRHRAVVEPTRRGPSGLGIVRRLGLGQSMLAEFATPE